jgi:hypothetical protein
MAEKYSVPFGRCVASREYGWRPKKGRARKVKVEIGTPVAVPGSDWGCRVRISGLPERIDRGIFGIDAIQALELALQFSGKELLRFVRSRKGQVELWDRAVDDEFRLALPLPLASLQGSLENLRTYLNRFKVKGPPHQEWRRGILIVMREIERDLSQLASRANR